ncbi:MAG: glycosyltransferase family 61 protein [Candidatus Devosia phytovorans]|uniref:Glycosyltransferase family 61 protein n=1 Tax=Candidatus Devosia phytovorans TaxID=3121372 RepID=A0AAJ5VU94_9HYPH|nr:glycosyltransferase family 61 protein [Devosia sp.]WEK03707.1 MAG: glycosyltransferase family 61 protein [Devosia sp.]
MVILPPLEILLTHLRGARPDFWDFAEESWEMAPAEERIFPAAIFLPGQLDRIEQTIFGDLGMTLNALTISGTQQIGPTIAARFRDVLLHDGVLYKNSAAYHLTRRNRRLPTIGSPPSIASAAIYDSWIGLRYFGNWLMDDTETFRLAETVGNPVSISKSPAGHKQDYEDRLTMQPLRTQSAQFDELVLFEDLANNSGKMARGADRRARLLSSIPETQPHPGVFLLRGRSGDARILTNEQKLAEDLEARHGIRAVDTMAHSVESLIKTCAGARVLIGVEGSQLVHALAVMAPGTTMLALMPPDRVTAAMKLMTDRLGMNFAMVIGQGTTDGFEINPKDIEATLDLIP